jgi:PAS domain S-box-containing protein
VPLAGGGAVCTFTDVTARRKAERRIKESEARYRLLANHATDMIVRTGAGGVDLYVSPACRDLIGYEQHEIAGMSFRDHLHPEDTEAVLAGLGRLFAGTQDHETSTYRVRHKSGHWVWVEAHRRLVRDAGGNPQEVVSVVRDVSARRGLEEQLRQAQKMEAVGQLTGGIAHDFNNLLTVVIGNAEVLAEELQEPESRGLAALILESAEKGAGLTQQLLAFGRRQTLRAEALDVPAVVQGMLPLLRRTLGETVILKTEFPSPPPTALADRSLLESAILNLAINARDAMPAGGLLEIVVDEVFVDAGARVDGPVPGHYVSDTGSGMSPEVLQHAFEPFFTTKGIGKGSGLGLSMVYGFAQQSGGHVSIRSKPAGGTSVTILLPLALASSAEPKPSEPSRMSRTRGSRVLVVEDELEVRRFMTSLLLTLGYEVVEAGTGSTGLKMIRSDPTLDLLLTDVVLPGGVSGLELAREAQRIRPNLKVLLTSGYPEPVSKDDGAMPGMEVLQKPYRRRDLAEAVRRVLDARPLTRRAGV